MGRGRQRERGTEDGGEGADVWVGGDGDDDPGDFAEVTAWPECAHRGMTVRSSPTTAARPAGAP